MEILIEKSKLAEMNLIKGLRWEEKAIQKELRPLKAGIDGYPMRVNGFTAEIKLLESKSFTAPIDFEVSTEVSDDPKLLEKERERFLEAQEIAQQKISEFKAQNLREIKRVKSALDIHRKERFARHEKDKKRIIELEELLEVVLARMNQFLIIDVRPMLSENEDDPF